MSVKYKSYNQKFYGGSLFKNTSAKTNTRIESLFYSTVFVLVLKHVF